MKFGILLLAATLALPAMVLAAADEASPADPFHWLEDVEGPRAMAWVEAQNHATTSELEKIPEFAPIRTRTQEILDSEARIAWPTLRGEEVYNFWQDAEHPRGIWRRTDLASYRTKSPVWETLLDVDALAEADGVPWAFKGATCLEPDYRLCMVTLSRGGGDTVVQREFDTAAKAFVKDGFELPEAKSDVAWKDADTLWVGTDFGDGSLTTSGYPRIVKLWRRGTPLAEAKTVLAGAPDDISVSGYTVVTPEGRYDVVHEGPTFFTSRVFLRLGERLVRLDIPDDARLQAFFKDHLVISLRTPWTVSGTTYPGGALLAIPLDDFLRGGRNFAVLFDPEPRTSLAEVDRTADRLLVTLLDNVRGRVLEYSLDENGAWSHREIGVPGLGSVSIVATSDQVADWFLRYADFLTPSSLFMVHDGTPAKLTSLPAFFDTDGMKVAQYEATSKDGTQIPYFVVTPKGFTADGTAPTVLYGYGGFEVSMEPSYSATMGSAWLARGGVWVLANIRGGGEFGPAWHQAAVQENHHHAIEDFIAVADDLIARKITSSPHLGIMGGSNGGLLVGAAFTWRPELFHAVVCQVPLLDMRRYTKLGAGASWISEYGDPDDPAQWAFMKKWSPYQLVKKDVKYPKVFFWTTTRDDRVHPGHARKMAALMESMGHPVYYWENTEGGHGAGTTNAQKAEITALEYAYLWKMLR